MSNIPDIRRTIGFYQEDGKSRYILYAKGNRGDAIVVFTFEELQVLSELALKYIHDHKYISEDQAG